MEIDILQDITSKLLENGYTYSLEKVESDDDEIKIVIIGINLPYDILQWGWTNNATKSFYLILDKIKNNIESKYKYKTKKSITNFNSDDNTFDIEFILNLNIKIID